MKTRTLCIIVVVAAVSIGLAGAAGAGPSRLAPGDPIAQAINYQGRLTDPSGTPLDGTFPMQFQIYDDQAAGTLLWDSGSFNVEVSGGLFDVVLKIDAADFNGQGLWLRVSVNGEWLSPRQALLPVPYALSLRPGAEVKGEPTAWDGWVVKATMDGAYPAAGAFYGSAATGAAVFGTSSGGFGLAAYTDNGYAVYGYDGGTEGARGYAGYFASANGIGVYGYSVATSTGSNAYAEGVYGRSVNGVGVHGIGKTDGVWGKSTDGDGVYGWSENGTGVYGHTDSTSTTEYGVYGRSETATGVYGRADGSAVGSYGVYGYHGGTVNGLGVYGYNEGSGAAVSAVNAGTGNGLWGYSAEANAISGYTDAADHNWGLRTVDNVYGRSFVTPVGIMQVVQNADAEPLERGDLVAISGLGATPAEGLPPVIQVRKVREPGSVAVVGVVSAGYAREWFALPGDSTGATGPAGARPESTAGPIAPGDYLLMVVQGTCQVKVDAVRGAIQPGDLLSSAGPAGVAGKAASLALDGVSVAAPGTVFGKALEPLSAGKGLIYVYVTLQ